MKSHKSHLEYELALLSLGQEGCKNPMRSSVTGLQLCWPLTCLKINPCRGINMAIYWLSKFYNTAKLMHITQTCLLSIILIYQHNNIINNSFSVKSKSKFNCIVRQRHLMDLQNVDSIQIIFSKSLWDRKVRNEVCVNICTSMNPST